MTTTIHEQRKERNELFPGTYDSTAMDEIIDFRNEIKDEYFNESFKFEPEHQLLRNYLWPFKKDANAGRELSEINEHYLTAILALSIYAEVNCEEFDLFFVKSIIGEILRRKPYMMEKLIGLTFPEIRDRLISNYKNTTKPKLFKYSDTCWPLHGFYFGRELKKIPTKVLISSLCVNSYCHPMHPLFDRPITEYIIKEIKFRMGDR